MTTRLLAALLFLLACTASATCEQPQAAAGQASGRPDRSNAATALEFDLPGDFSMKDANGAQVVTGFRVGYFRPGDAAPMTSIDVPRDAVIVTGRAGRLLLPSQQFPADVNSVVLRVQTLAARGPSEWSEASPPQPVAGRSVAGREPTRAPRSRPQVSMEDVEKYPQLVEALRTVLSPSVKIEEVLSSFRTVDELAVAVTISRDHGMTVEKIGRAMAGPPRQSIQAAVRELKPALRRTNAIQKARADAKQLLNPAQPPRP